MFHPGQPIDRVSILVFVELALDDLRVDRGSVWISLVSILVFVELALDALVSSVVPAISSKVSILVFVELALDVAPVQIKQLVGFKGFQSLFSWNLLLMSKVAVVATGGARFNRWFRRACSWWFIVAV